MANRPLIDLKPGAGLESGLFPTAEPTSGPIWRDGGNVWFRPLSAGHALGRTRALLTISRSSKAMTQAYADGETRLYFEDLGLVYKWDGEHPLLIGELSAESVSYDLEPFGTWLLATDNVNTVKIWKNDTNGFIAIGNSEFARGKIIKKLAQRVLVYSTDVLPAGMHYSKPSDPEEWRPVVSNILTGAGNLPFRNLDSEVIAVADLAGGHGVYTEDKMLFLQYLGETLKFGTPNPPIAGIGAAGRDSVISRGSRNWGLFEGGVFVTDGVTFKLIDDPAMSEWLRDRVDWDRGDEVVGYYDKKLRCNVWNVPLHLGGFIGVTVDDNGRFGFIDAAFTSALEQEIFNYPFVALTDGIYRASVKDTVLGTFTLNSQLLDAGIRTHYKHWDLALFHGTLSGQLRFGFTDEPDMDSIEWNAWQDLAHRVPFTPRESVFLAMQLSSEDDIQLSGIEVYGAQAGLVT